MKYFPIAPIMTTVDVHMNVSFVHHPFFGNEDFGIEIQKEVVDEIEYLVHVKGIKEIQMEDDNFTLKGITLKECAGNTAKKNSHSMEYAKWNQGRSGR